MQVAERDARLQARVRERMAEDERLAAEHAHEMSKLREDLAVESADSAARQARVLRAAAPAPDWAAEEQAAGEAARRRARDQESVVLARAEAQARQADKKEAETERRREEAAAHAAAAEAAAHALEEEYAADGGGGGGGGGGLAYMHQQAQYQQYRGPALNGAAAGAAAAEERHRMLAQLGDGVADIERGREAREEQRRLQVRSIHAAAACASSPTPTPCRGVSSRQQRWPPCTMPCFLCSLAPLSAYVC